MFLCRVPVDCLFDLWLDPKAVKVAFAASALRSMSKDWMAWSALRSMSKDWMAWSQDKV